MKEENGITYIDMGKGKVPRKTAGWSDKQIHNKPFDELEAMLNSAKIVLDTLRSSVKDQENRIHDFERILRRKKELNEEGYRPPAE